MKGLKRIFRITALKKVIVFLPIIILRVRNWPIFLLNYSGLYNKHAVYTFRNNIKIEAKGTIDTATIALVFFNNDYGTVKSKSTIIDIGANIGAFTLFAAMQHKANVVYAFEPFPETYNALCNNIAINDLVNTIYMEQTAVGDSDNERQFYIGGESIFNTLYGEVNQEHLNVNGTTLDTIFVKNNIGRCDLLKLDCEGAEYEILNSASDDTLRKINNIRLEYHRIEGHENGPEELEQLLNSKGFITVRFEKHSASLGLLWFRQDGI